MASSVCGPTLVARAESGANTSRTRAVDRRSDMKPRELITLRHRIRWISIPAVLSSVSLTVSLMAASTAAADAPDRLITKHGVELRADERVFVLFAALNALEFNEETRRKGPPLRAPEFHPIRVQIRDALRAQDDAGNLAGIRSMFEANPAEIEVYLEAVLGGEGLSSDAQKL